MNYYVSFVNLEFNKSNMNLRRLSFQIYLIHISFGKHVFHSILSRIIFKRFSHYWSSPRSYKSCNQNLDCARRGCDIMTFQTIHKGFIHLCFSYVNDRNGQSIIRYESKFKIDRYKYQTQDIIQGQYYVHYRYEYSHLLSMNVNIGISSFCQLS